MHIIEKHYTNIDTFSAQNTQYKLTNNKFKQYKRINIRYDKYTTNFIKYILLAAIENNNK